MTSKEALENIIKFLQELEDNSILTIPAFSEYLKEIKVINKDLEILEFIKNHIQYTDNGLWYIDICEDDFDLKSEMTKEEWNNSIQKKIREWLNNGKSRSIKEN
jgi:hypothetical protein